MYLNNMKMLNQLDQFLVYIIKSSLMKNELLEKIAHMKKLLVFSFEITKIEDLIKIKFQINILLEQILNI